MRIQFDTPDIYEDHTRTRFRYLRGDWKYGTVKGGFDSEKDKTPLDNIVREFNEEVMFFDSREAFQPMNITINRRHLYSIHLDDATELCAGISQRKTMYYGELFDVELRTTEQVRQIWTNLNHTSKKALAFIDPSFV